MSARGLILLHMNIVFSQCHLWNRFSFPHWVFLAPSSSISWAYTWSLVLGSLFCSISLCLFLYQYHAVKIIRALEYKWNQELCSSSFIMSQDCFGFSKSLWVHTNFRIFFLFLWKMPLEFWYKLHWNYRWYWVVLTF